MSDDAISRQAADDYIVKLLSGYLYDEERTRLEELSAYLWELPSVKPQEPCDKCEVGNPCLYCKHEFEPQESEEKE